MSWGWACKYTPRRHNLLFLLLLHEGLKLSVFFVSHKHVSLYFSICLLILTKSLSAVEIVIYDIFKHLCFIHVSCKVPGILMNIQHVGRADVKGKLISGPSQNYYATLIIHLKAIQQLELKGVFHHSSILPRLKPNTSSFQTQPCYINNAAAVHITMYYICILSKSTLFTLQ